MCRRGFAPARSAAELLIRIVRPLEALHAAIPTSEIAILDGLGHLAPEKNAAALARCIGDFFDASLMAGQAI